MKVTLKLYASLGAFLPAGATRNAIQLDVPDGATIGAVLAAHQVPRENCHLILVNGTFAPPATADGKMLHDGDTVAVWPPVAGG
jgi:molybdopterin converting factor small subunit